MTISPSVRISVGLVFLTVSILIVAEMFGLSPNNQSIAELDARKKVCESLAIQYSMAAQRNDLEGIQLGMNIMVKRNADILSIGLRGANGILKASSVNHQQGWADVEGKKSTPTHAQVPIFNGDKHWGTVEIQFVPLSKVSFYGVSFSPLFLLILFVSVSGFFGYLFIMKRTLKHLDPSNVMPARVKQALDALTEGVVLLDEKGRIVMANKAFVEKIGRSESSILGEKIAAWKWRIRNEDDNDDAIFSWVKAMRSGNEVTGQVLDYELKNDEIRTFVVNGSPIYGDNKSVRGALATFYDITDVEEKNIALERIVKQLNMSRNEIQEKNKELKILSEIDPLTGLLNRRRFFELLGDEFEKINDGHSQMIVIMVDIDHFKSINDTFGHVKGDEIIKKVAKLLTSNLRNGSCVGRYGGEEFCIFMPQTNVTTACKVAERIRKKFSEIFTEITVTASFGISSTFFKAESVTDIIAQADDSLYISKHEGRNRATLWSPIISQKLIDFKARAAALSKKKNNNRVAEIVNINDDNSKISDVDAEFISNGVLHGEGVPPRPITDKELFYDHIEQAIKAANEHAKLGAVLVLGIDKLSRVNEAYGRETGDSVIIEVGKRVVEFIRQDDMSAWLALDDNGKFNANVNLNIFGLVFRDIDDIEMITSVAIRIIESMASPIITHDQEIFITLSVGISVFPGDGNSAEHLFKRAVSALVEAKKKGRNSFNYYNSGYVGNALQHLESEKELYQAIQSDEFILHYQPKIDLRTGAVTCFEALVRWQHPRKGMIPPDKFIPIAEDSGLIVPLGAMVLRNACEEYNVWSSQGYPGVKIAVNLSARQLESPGIRDSIIEILEDAQVDPHMLELEITETALMSNVDIISPLLRELQDAGITISIDDFGVGHSSLNYLKRLPIDILKIDKCFISELAGDEQDKSIVVAILAMSEKMGLKVVAEGVETQEQLKTLIQLGCDEVQGFYFSKPVPAVDIIELLHANNYVEMVVGEDINQSKSA